MFTEIAQKYNVDFEFEITFRGPRRGRRQADDENTDVQIDVVYTSKAESAVTDSEVLRQNTSESTKNGTNKAFAESDGSLVDNSEEIEITKSSAETENILNQTTLKTTTIEKNENCNFTPFLGIQCSG